ncbi:substrate-binding domain-containing protein [Streptomyces sp. NPDC007861]|uniref:substrate-binding domain-containing protein n=1 Tax=Streptomyces sp. NPDC007861 TaxID=3154893 RepID=UPI0033ED6539
MRFTMEERHQRIIELVRSCGTVRLVELADHLDISTVTARRDVDTLAGRGIVDRARGVVSWPDAPSPAERLQHAERGAPDTTAAPAASASGPVLGMVVPSTRHYFEQVVRGAGEAAAAAGGRLVLGFSGYSQSPDFQIGRMLDSGVEGLLLTPNWPTGVSGQDSPGLEFGVPVVLVERRGAPGTGAARLDRVCTDHAAGAGLAVERLAGLGHERIALVAGDSPTRVQVMAGFETALRTLGLARPPVEAIEFRAEDPDPARQEAAVGRLADAVRTREVTAVLVISDTDAILLLQLLRDRGVEVPRDLALVAYDDEVAALSELPLTAVAPPKYAVGQAAVRLLQQRVRERAFADAVAPSPRQHLDLLPELRVRASCGVRL